MTSTVMARLFFVAGATALSHLFHLGYGGDDKSSQSVRGKATPALWRSSSLDERPDLITELPGLYFDPGFEQYAGYLTVDEKHGRNLFYWYFDSQNDPDNDPVVLWTNGGPGCSGLIGMGTEQGPFFIDANGTLAPNPFSWNKLANMLYIEQPAGVGFSYSERVQDYTTGDAQAASDMYLLIREFLTAYPERRSNDFYIASESYGGHYMPQLTKEILDRNYDGFINFKGMMVGNPFVDPYSNTLAQFKAWYSHGLLPAPVYQKWLDHCQDPNIYLSEKCQHYMEDMYGFFDSRINPYGLDYPMCNEDPRIYNPVPGSQINAPIPISSQVATLVNYTAPIRPDNPPFLPAQDHYRPCAEEHLDRYLNRQDVKAAIHARHDKSHHSWKDCSNTIRYSEHDWKTPTLPLYKELLSMLSEHHIHIFVFSGDDDSICSLAGTQTWIWDLGAHPQIGETWKPWKMHNQTAGFVTKFHVQGGSFTFATVHGAGHEVPLYRPMEALQLFQNYLTGKW